MPAGAVYVGRPSKWGNPFVAFDWQAAFRAVALVGRGDRAGMRAAAVRLYELWLTAETRSLSPAEIEALDFWDREVFTVRPAKPRPTLAEIRDELRGKDLACWCPLDGKPCHADVLLRLATKGKASAADLTITPRGGKS